MLIINLKLDCTMFPYVKPKSLGIISFPLVLQGHFVLNCAASKPARFGMFRHVLVSDLMNCFNGNLRTLQAADELKFALGSRGLPDTLTANASV